MKKNIWITYVIFILVVITFFSFYNNCLSQESENHKKETLEEKQRMDTLAGNRDLKFVAQLVQRVSYMDTLHPLDSAGIHRLAEEIVSTINNRNTLQDNSKEYMLEKSIDDARQETNNIINKVNGWISFWIAMLAFIGGLIPALMAVRNAEESERKLEQYKAGLKELFKSEMNFMENRFIENVKTSNDKVKELKQLQKELTLENEKHKIISIVNTIITSVTPSIFKSHTNRKVFMRIFLMELRKNFASFIKCLIKEQTDDPIKDYTDEVIMMLIHLELGLIKSRTVYTDCQINREFETFLYKIKDVIDDLTKTKLSTGQLIEKLNQVYAYFPALLRVI